MLSIACDILAEIPNSYNEVWTLINYFVTQMHVCRHVWDIQILNQLKNIPIDKKGQFIDFDLLSVIDNFDPLPPPPPPPPTTPLKCKLKHLFTLLNILHTGNIQ